MSRDDTPAAQPSSEIGTLLQSLLSNPAFQQAASQNVKGGGDLGLGDSNKVIWATKHTPETATMHGPLVAGTTMGAYAAYDIDIPHRSVKTDQDIVGIETARERFAQMDKNAIQLMQNDMIRAGLLDGNKYQPGFGADPHTQESLGVVMRAAQLMGKSIPETLAMMKKHPSAFGIQKAESPEALHAKEAYNQYLAQLMSTYISTWGINPPAGYIERAAAAHMNLYEFEAHERAKPAFKNSPRYQDERIQLQKQISDWMGGNV